MTGEELLAYGSSLPETGLREYADSVCLTFRGRGIAYVDPDGDVALVKATRDDREALVGSAPDVYAPSHTSGRFGWVEVRLDLVDPDELRELLLDAWRHSAPRRLVRAFDEAGA